MRLKRKSSGIYSDDIIRNYTFVCLTPKLVFIYFIQQDREGEGEGKGGEGGGWGGRGEGELGGREKKGNKDERKREGAERKVVPRCTECFLPAYSSLSSPGLTHGARAPHPVSDTQIKTLSVEASVASNTSPSKGLFPNYFQAFLDIPF